MNHLNTAPTDVLAETLTAVRVQSSVYCLSDLRAPWGFRVEGADTPKFHVVLEGACWLEADGLDPVKLGEGDLVILALGHGHVMSNEPGTAAPGLDAVIADHPLDASAHLEYGGDGARTRLLCGGLALGTPLPTRLLACLPPILQMDSVSLGVTSWIDAVFALVRQEADRAAPGAQAIFAKLADIFLSQALRTYLTGADQTGLLQLESARDAQIEKAAELLSQQPTRQWTLQGLAREVGLSRTLLAARFREATGDSPMRHLAKVRLGQAAGYLITANLSVEAIARRTGYASDASLSKAFKREFGVSPGCYRRRGGRIPWSEPLDDGDVRLATALAHSQQSVAAAGSLE
jgi:AraC-like DNA-binding protein